jgi:hypothetical protein
MTLRFRRALTTILVALAAHTVAAQTILTLGSGSGFSAPQSIALDSAGNVYVADYSNKAVKEILAAGGYTTVNTLYTGPNFIAGVAVDSSGNIYFTNYIASGSVMELLAVGGVIPASPTVVPLGGTFSNPAGVSVDSSGNVFVTEYNTHLVKEILAAGGYTTVNTLSTAFTAPFGVAVDSSGNVYVADLNGGVVKELLAVGGVIPAIPTVNTLGSGFTSPQGVWVDNSGDVYVTDKNGAVVKEMLAVGGVIPATPTIRTIGSGFTKPTGVVIDSHGNVFVTDGSSNKVKEILATTHLSVSAPTPQPAGSAFSVTVIALDANNNIVTDYPGTVHLTSSDGSATLPIDAVLTNGTGAFQVTLSTLGNQTVTATDTVTGSITGTSSTILVSTGAATHLTVTAASPETVGSAFNFTVTARDASNNIALGYGGIVHFTSTDGSASLPANSTLTNGTGTFVATLLTAGNETITATDIATASITGNSGAIVVNPAGATHFIVSAASPETAGSAFSFTVTARDANNNTATGYAGTIHFTSSDAAATLPANSALTNGAGTFSATLKIPGSQAITATDTVTASIVGTSGTIVVNPGAATHFIVSAASPETVGSAFSCTVTAQDAANNTATAYAGTVHFISSDGSAVLPANSTLISGVGTFPLTLLTAGNQIVTATDTVTGSITGTSSTIVVNPGLATHFTVSATSPQAAGATFNFIVTALDAGNFIASGYSGTVHFTSSDGAATLPANSTLTNGTGTFPATLKTAGSQSIAATDTVTASITGTSSTIIVNFGSANHFTVLAGSPETAGSAFSFTVTARDATNNTAAAYAGTVHFTSSDASAILPANSTLVNGIGTFPLTLLTAGNQTVTATDTVTGAITGASSTIAVNPGAATHFTVSAGSPQAPGTAFHFLVTAFDANNNTATGYSGSVHFSSTDGSATLPANATLTNGTGTFWLTLLTAGNQTVTATDTVTASITGASNTIVVNPGGTNHFSVSAGSPQTAGTAFHFTVTALDAAGNTTTGYAGTVHLTSSDGSAVLPPNSTLINGTGTFPLTLLTAGNQTVTATDTVTGSTTGTSSTIVVNPGSATHFTVSAGSPQIARTAFNFTVTALDTGNNTAMGYSGTVHFTSSDSSAVLPPNSALVNGVGTFPVTLLTVGNQTVTATDTVTVSITGTSSTIAVNPGTATHFAVSAGSPQSPGTAFQFLVTALDANNITATGYSGSVHFSSTDGSATLPANSTLTNGAGTFSLTLITAGNQTVTATDTVTASLTGTSNPIVVNPGPATHLSVAAASPQTAGTAFHITVTARDANNNVASGYSGTVHFSSSDGAAALPANSSVTNGVRTFSATLNTQGMQTVTATDTVTASITGTSSGISVPALAPIAVTSLADAGPGTLRAAITNANTQQGGAIAFTVTGTVHLASPLPALTQSMSLTGLGPSSLAIDGGGAVQVLNVSSGITVSISGVTLQNGLDTGGGGGGIANQGILTLTSCAIAGNVEAGSGLGGGISNSGTLTVNQCTVSNNQAGGAGSSGGGLFNQGTVTITNSTFSANAAIGGSVNGGKGGAIFNSAPGLLTIAGSTIAGNQVTDPSGAGSAAGGAIYDLGSASIANTTLSGNSQTGTVSGDLAGGIFVSAGSCSLTGTILAGNTDLSPSPHPDGAGTFTNGGNNLVGDPAGITGFTNGVNGTLVGTHAAPLGPQLSTLASNGGPTQTMLPGGNSPALGAGSTTGAPAADQRGFARVVNGAIDIGAVQLQGVALAASAGTPQSAGVNTAFGTALAVSVSESCASCTSAVAGVPVTFSAPGTGPSGTFAASATVTATVASNASGVATAPTFTANAVVGGPYPVTASATTPEQAVPASASFALTNIGVNQTITGFGAIGPHTYGAVFTISGVAATSGLTVLFASTTTAVCTVSGTAVTIVSGTGTCSITASQPGNFVYPAAASVIQSFAVSKAGLTITANSASKTYGTALAFAGSEFMPSGLINGDAVSGVTLTSSGAAVAAGVAGSPYSIVAGAATGSGLSNYAIAYVNGSLTVNPATLTVTAANASKVYGALLPALGYTIAGFANGDTAAVVSGTPSLFTTASWNSVVGSYPITVSGTLSASNYAFAFAKGTLAITKASTNTLLTSLALKALATVLVTPPAAGTPTGTVQFLSGSTVLGSVALTGPLALIVVPAGTVTAVYSGDANFLGSTSLPGTVYSAATSSLTFTSSATPSSLGQSVTFTAALTTSGPPDTPTGTVQFFDSTQFLGSVTLTNAQAAYTTAALAGGSHTIIASYSGDATFPGAQASFAQSVNAAATLAVTAAPAAAVFGQAVTVTATVASAALPAGFAGPTGQVSYSLGSAGSPLGAAALASGTSSLSVTTLPLGNNVVTAQYSGDSTWSSSKGTVNVTVSQASTATAISLTIKSGQLALTVVTTPVSPGAGTPTGTVQLVNTANKSSVATIGLSNGTASVNIPASVAALPIAAVYGGDTNFLGSTSPTLLATTNAAAGLSTTVAPDEVASLFNVTGLSGNTPATLPLPTTLGGVTVTVTDSAGVARLAPLYGVFGSAGQINFMIPSGTASGLATVTVALPSNATMTTVVQVASSAAGTFTANMNGQGVFAGQVIYVSSDGTQTTASSTVLNSTTNQFVPNPINLSTPGQQVVLVLYGTGIRHAASLTAAIDGVSLPVLFYGAQGQFPGLDQINLRLPNSLAGSGLVNLTIAVDGQAANPVTTILQ